MDDFSHDGIVAQLGRTTDKDGWLDPMLADADGAAALGALIEQFVRMGKAVDYTGLIGYISSAPGGGWGTCQLTMTRPASGTSGTIPAGYQFLDERGVVLILATPVVVASGATQIILPLRTLRLTEAVNTEDDAVVVVASGAGIVKDSLGTTSLITPPGNGTIVSTTFQIVTAATQILGGSSDWLSVHGAERGQIRQFGEDTDAYRARVRNIPDAVGPLAIGQAVQAAASRAGFPQFVVLEPFPQLASSDIVDPLGLDSFDPFFADDNVEGFTGDQLSELVGRREATAYFRIEPTAPLQDPQVLGMFCDFGFCDDPVMGFLDTGADAAIEAALMSMWEDVNGKKAGGVGFDIFTGAATRLIPVGHSAANSDTTVWSVFAPAGKTWMYVDGYYGHGFDFAPLPTTLPLPASRHQIKFTFSDATTYTTPAFTSLYEERITLAQYLARSIPVKPITRIDGIIRSDGTHPVNLVGNIFVFEVTS